MSFSCSFICYGVLRKIENRLPMPKRCDAAKIANLVISQIYGEVKQREKQIDKQLNPNHNRYTTYHPSIPCVTNPTLNNLHSAKMGKNHQQPLTKLTSLLVTVVCLTWAATSIVALVGPSTNPKPVHQSYVDQIESTVQSMEARWRTLDQACDTNAPFSLIYLYMTRELKSHIQSQYFDDNNLMSNFTRAFAQRYEDAINAWMASSVNAVGVTDPWMTAFRYGYSNKSSVLEDLFLGMNAHINYDLALIVSGLKYGKAENKNDYDRINDILTAMMPVVSDDIASRYYSFMNSTLVDIFSPAGLLVLFGWRQNAWNNGVLIQNALTDIDRGLLMVNLKTQAMLGTVPYMSYNLGFPTNVTRTAFCQDHHH